jgi:LasA protease
MLTRVRRWLMPPAAVLMLALAGLACVRDQPAVIYITATFLPPTLTPAPIAIVPTQAPPAQATAVPLNTAPATPPQTYVVQPGDNLTQIALNYGVALETLLELNTLTNPDILEVGQVLQIPAVTIVEAPAQRLIPDGRLVRGPGSLSFDTQAYLARQTGYVAQASDTVNEIEYPASVLIERVSLEYSVDARLLLALLEYRSRWLSQNDVPEQSREFPLNAPPSAAGFERRGLYRQLTWAADTLNFAYYRRQADALVTVGMQDNTVLRLSPASNSATAAVHTLIARTATADTWERDIGEQGLMATYRDLFGDPFADGDAPLVPNTLAQPELALPFAANQSWYFTGGAHGGWGSGSAWAAVDFAPPDDLTQVTSSCYTSSFYATAVADGVVARVDTGLLVLDLDGDGSEHTGWSILYLHISSEGRPAVGTRLVKGDRVGRPNCEGGFSNGTHLHIARRYNGEWIPANCLTCSANPRPDFVLGGWRVESLPGQEYQGYLTQGGRRLIAEQGRGIADNEVRYED